MGSTINGNRQIRESLDMGPQDIIYGNYKICGPEDMGVIRHVDIQIWEPYRDGVTRHGSHDIWELLDMWTKDMGTIE
ncbi:hypothetical protein Bpfe_015205 [Biomphalaria pfeifferi]|uniref:Uncharacterized protein n=1 Tax=Biomphalaria pfeifferi TaxID=112525 RepID=A0AAD8F8N8_BIOPF|nr:hypothetical protein Bpfe_015205 [Biomphalaria pfeifferi]